MSRRRASGRTAALAVLLWVLAGIPAAGPPPAGAAGAGGNGGPEIGSYTLTAWGSGLTQIYDQPSAGIPADPTGEMHVAYSLARLDTGPFGHGVASEVWPGPTVATAGPFVESTFFDKFNDEWEANSGQDSPVENPRAAPLWPVRAETFSPQGPADAESTLGPLGAMRSHAEGLLVTADTHSQGVVAPAIVSVDSVASSTRSAVERDGTLGRDVARATARSRAESVSILDGLVEVGAVVTEASVWSDGASSGLEGETVVEDLVIAGQEFRIDESGIHAAGEQVDPITGQLNAAAEAVLAESGVELVLAPAVDFQEGAAASRSLGGLILRMRSERAEDAVAALPEPLRSEMRSNVTFDHAWTVVLGAVNVETLTTPPVEFRPFRPAQRSSDGGAGFSTAPARTPQTVPAMPLPPDDAGGEAAAEPAPTIRTQPAFAAPVSVDGVPVEFAVLVVLLGLAAARFMPQLADTLLGGGRSAKRGGSRGRA